MATDVFINIPGSGGILPVANGGSGASTVAGGPWLALNGSNSPSATINWGAQNLVNVAQLGVGTTSPATTTSIDIVNQTGATQRIVQTGYGGQVGLRGRYANGTLSSPTAATSGNILEFISGQGYGTSQFPTSSTGAINVVAGETFTNTSNATYLQFETTPTGSTTIAEAMRVNSTGNLLIGTTTDSGTEKLQVSGNSNVGTVTTGTWNGSVTAGRTILTSGTTYTTPSNITAATLFKLTIIGGGGGGGGIAASNVGAAGGGGGGVGYVWLTGLAPSTAYSYVIGAGGTGGANTGSTAGGTGGATSITINSVTHSAGAGGGAAAKSSNTNGAAGGSCTNVDLNLIGGNGGGASATAGVGSGMGGDAVGWGNGGAVQCADANGINGRGFGGGGSGGKGTAAGGSGAQGGIIIEWQN